MHIIAPKINNKDQISLDDFARHVQKNVTPGNEQDLLSMGPYLQNLASNQNLLCEHINDKLKSNFYRDNANFTPNVFTLRQFGDNNVFMIRMIVWPAKGTSDNPEVFAYHVGHDHSFSLLTCGFYGPGYLSRFYQYDNQDNFSGYPNEEVPSIHFNREIQLTKGKVILIEANKDIHTQFEPDSLSISLNLVMFPIHDNPLRYFFDTKNKRVLKTMSDNMTLQLNLLKIAQHLGDQNTLDIINEFSQVTTCKIAKASAYQTLIAMDPDNHAYYHKKMISQLGYSALTLDSNKK